jgi:O-antigen/teichoic acid export membrane protein
LNEPDSPSLRSAASRSLLWTAVGKYSNNLITLVVMAVLSRLLTPTDFGLIAMVLVISAFLSIVAEAGLSTAVVQKRDLSDDALSSLFWFGLGLGALTAALLAGAAPLVALLFSEPRLTPVVAVMSGGFLIVALGRVPNGLLERSFKFREIAVSELTGSLFGGIVGVGAALGGAGHWALVMQSLTTSLLNAALRFRLSGFRPRRVLRLELVRSVSGYSGGVTAFSAINYWARNLDKALIGRFLGPAELGYYGRAYALMLYPLETINGILNPTLHPLLSALQHDGPRMARTYATIAKLVASIALPAMTAMGALAPEIVRSVWGAQWTPSIDVFAILCIVGSVQPVGATFGPVFLATNRTKLLALMGLINSCVIMAGMAAGIRWGIEGVAVGYSIGYGLIFFPTMYVVFVVLLRARLADMLRVLGTPLAMAAAVLAALSAYNSVMRGRWGDVPHGLLGLLVAITVWAASYLLFDRPLLERASSLLPTGVRGRLVRWRIVRESDV